MSIELLGISGGERLGEADPSEKRRVVFNECLPVFHGFQKFINTELILKTVKVDFFSIKLRLALVTLAGRIWEVCWGGRFEGEAAPSEKRCAVEGGFVGRNKSMLGSDYQLEFHSP